jgi:hypothetical protein
MKHVIVDRPRTGGDGGKSIPPKGSKKRLQKTPLEEQSKFQSNAAGRIYGWDCKQLNEHLSPLLRWLHSQCGRDWDEVWSEICEGLSVRNATTAHVRDHADNYVTKDCYIGENGDIYDSCGHVLNSGWRWKEFYVDPRDNTLREAPVYNWTRTVRKRDWVPGDDDNHRYYLLNGAWYEVTLEDFPGGSPHYAVWDGVIAMKWEGKKKYTGSHRSDCKNFYGREVYAGSKRQLGKRDIHRLKLWDSEIGKEYREAA